MGPRACAEFGFVAASAAIAAAVLAYPDAEGPRIGSVVAVVLAGAWIVWDDVRTMTIPDATSLAIAILGAATRMADAPDSLIGREGAILSLDAALAGGMLWLLREIYHRRRGIDAIGLGDVKLAAAGAVLIGTTAFFWALFAASLAGIAVTALRRRRGAGSSDRLAFGALLAPACCAVWLLRS